MQEVNTQSSLSPMHRAQDNARLFLSELSAGEVGIFRLLAWCVAYVQALLTQGWDRAKAELQDIAAKSEPATDVWLAEKAKEFRWKYNPFTQENDYLLQVNADNIPVWSDEALADESALVVKYAAAETSAGNCLLKVCGQVGNEPTVLDNSVKNGLAKYIDRLSPPGASIIIVSRMPDWLQLNAKVYYNPLFDLATTQQGVLAALKNYLNNLPFNGVISLNHLSDAIRKVPGVNQLEVTFAKGRRSGDDPNSSNNITFTRQYVAFAGAAKYDAVNSTLQFIPVL